MKCSGDMGWRAAVSTSSVKLTGWTEGKEKGKERSEGMHFCAGQWCVRVSYCLESRLPRSCDVLDGVVREGILKIVRNGELCLGPWGGLAIWCF